MLTALDRLARRARDARRDGDDAGFSLTEIMVGMVMAAIVGAMLVNWFSGASDTNTATADSSNATANARNTLQSWSSYLHVAASPTELGSGTGRITALSPNSITFYASLANSGTCAGSGSCTALTTTPVTLSLTNAAGGGLTEKIGSATATYDVSAPLVTTGTVTTSTPYGNCLFTVATATGTLGCTSLTQAQLDTVTSVTLAFTVTPQSGHPRSYTTTSAFTTEGTSGA